MSPDVAEPDRQLRQVLRRNLRDALNRGDLPAAAAALERLEESAPLAPDTRLLALELLLRQRRLQEAGALAGQLLTLYPGEHRVQYLAGNAAYRVRDYARARECFAEAERIQPFWKNRRWLGKTLTNLGQLDAAESLLSALADQHPECLQDLAWLHQRRGDPLAALALLERHAEHFPDDRFAAAARKRLRAEALSAEEIEEEMALAEELGEEPAAELVPRFVQALLETGQGARAREYVQRQRPGWERGALRAVAWVCHQLQAPDLAFELFLALFPGERGYVKYMNAMEKDAELSGRIPDLIERYQATAPQDRTLYGRVKRLQKRLGS